MSRLTWVHLSDWHQSRDEFQRQKVRDALIADLRDRAKLDPALEELDFAVFTGDAAFSGQTPEYQAARAEFFSPVLQAADITPDRLLLIPGNHDVDRAVLAVLSADLVQKAQDKQALNQLLTDPRVLRVLLEPFSDYTTFARALAPFEGAEHPAFGYSRTLDRRGLRVHVLGLNSALFSGHHKDAAGAVTDQGFLLLGEPQYIPLVSNAPDADVTIALVHHPFSWLAESERHTAKALLSTKCDFILHGHEHTPNIEVVDSPTGRCTIVPCGAAFHHDNSPFSYAYNLIVLDLDGETGTVYLRIWSERGNRWGPDYELHDRGAYPFSFARRSTGGRKETAPSADRDAHHGRALKDYRRRLQHDYGYADHRGIAGVTGTPFAASLPADELYVVPTLVPADKPELRERERELLKLLEDADVSLVDKSRYEEEYAALTGQQWQRRRPSTPDYSVGAALQQARHVVLLGGPGVGKSALTRFLVRTCIEGGDVMKERLGWSEELLPILVPLAAFAEAYMETPQLTLQSFILDRLGERGGVPLREVVEERLQRSACIVLLDGIDEVPDGRTRAKVVRAVDRFLADNPETRCVVTSRPYGYIRLAGPLPHFTLPNFSEQQVEAFVKNYYRASEQHTNPAAPLIDKADADARALLDEIKENQRIAELATNPLMLVIIALIRYERAHLIEERVQLYHRAVTTLVDTWAQWRSAGGPDVRPESLPLDRVLRVWAAVAHWMHETRPNGVVHRNELLRELQRVLAEREVSGDQSPEDLAQQYFDVVAGSGLLEERAAEIFAFWHPTFEEFLAAIHLCTPSGQAQERLLPLRTDPRWREVILLAVGYIGLIVLDDDTATALIDAIAYSSLDPSEPLGHALLRLAVAAVTDFPGVRRSSADALLLRLVTALAHHDQVSDAEALAHAGRALSRLRPSDNLLAGLSGLESHHMWEVRMEVARLAGNCASVAPRGKEICRRLLDDVDPDVRCYAAYGLVRAGMRGPAEWQPVLERYDTRFTLLEPALRVYVAGLDEGDIEKMVMSADGQLARAVRLIRRSGRMTDELRKTVRARLDAIGDTEVAGYVRASRELEEMREGLPAYALQHRATAEPRARFEVGVVLIDSRVHASAGREVLKSILMDDKTSADISLDAISRLTSDGNDSQAAKDGSGVDTDFWVAFLRHWLERDETDPSFVGQTLVEEFLYFTDTSLHNHVLERCIEEFPPRLGMELVDRPPVDEPFQTRMALAAIEKDPADERTVWRAVSVLTRNGADVETYIAPLRGLVDSSDRSIGAAPAALLAGVSSLEEDKELATERLRALVGDDAHRVDALSALYSLGYPSVLNLADEQALPQSAWERAQFVELLVEMGETQRALDVAESIGAMLEEVGEETEDSDNSTSRFIIERVSRSMSLAADLTNHIEQVRSWFRNGSPWQIVMGGRALFMANLTGDALDGLGSMVGQTSRPLSLLVSDATSEQRDIACAAWDEIAVLLRISDQAGAAVNYARRFLLNYFLSAIGTGDRELEDDIPF
jgi:hypothetical protein